MKELNLHTLCAALALTGCLISCGGGGGGANSGLPIDPLLPTAQVPADPASFNFSGGGGDSGSSGGDGGAGGAAGDGAPIRKAVIVITDATGKTANGLTDDNGNYFIKFTGFTAPLVAKVVDAGGNVLASATEEQPTTGKAVRIMINPLTDKIVSDSVVDGVVLGTDKAFNGSKLDLTKFATAKTNLRTSINAALATAGVTSTAFDPIKSNYAYDGTGVDAVIESISHTRNPMTGETQLRAKLVNVDTTTLITAAAPLAAVNVATPANQTLTFAKLQAWTNQLNACLAIAPGTATPCDNNAKGLRSNSYLHSSKDYFEDFRAVFSDGTSRSVAERVPSVTLRNPVVLFIGKYPNSTATYDDLAVVEMTVKQPYIGPLGPNGATVDPVEYVQYLVFKRDDTLVGAAGGNWVLHGNQRSYDIGVSPSYETFSQVNPAKSPNLIGNIPSLTYSELQFSISPNKYNAATQTWANANIRAVRVKGAGLPAAGLVLTPNATLGSTSLSIHNAQGIVNTSAMVTNYTTSGYRLDGIAMDGTPLYSGFWPTTLGAPGTTPHFTAVPAVTDFAALPAFTPYQFEVFLNSNTGNTVPDSIEFSRTLAPVVKPSIALAMPLNGIGSAFALVTPPQAASNTVTINWAVNLNAAPVTFAYLYAEERSPKGSPTNTTPIKWIASSNVTAAYSLNSRPSSVVVNYTGTPPMPSFTTQVGDYREIGIRSWQGRSNVHNKARWNN